MARYPEVDARASRNLHAAHSESGEISMKRVLDWTLKRRVPIHINVSEPRGPSWHPVYANMYEELVWKTIEPRSSERAANGEVMTFCKTSCPGIDLVVNLATYACRASSSMVAVRLVTGEKRQAAIFVTSFRV